MGEIVSIVPDLFEFWEARLVECENGAEIATRNLARLALSEQLQLDYEDMQDLQEGAQP